MPFPVTLEPVTSIVSIVVLSDALFIKILPVPTLTLSEKFKITFSPGMKSIALFTGDVLFKVGAVLSGIRNILT